MHRRSRGSLRERAACPSTSDGRASKANSFVELKANRKGRKQMRKRGKYVLAAAAGMTVVLGASRAQADNAISLGNPAGGTYTQDFNTLPITGTSSSAAGVFDNDITIPGWYANRSSNPEAGVWGADDGSSGTGALYFYGTTGSTDRALGSVASGTTGQIAYGAKFINNAGASTIINSITITYTGEQWRNGGNATVQPLTFSYRIGGAQFPKANTTAGSGTVPSSTAAADDSITSGFTIVPALTFNSPVTGATASALDGNAAANRTPISSSITGLNIAPGTPFWVRFYDVNDAGNDHGLAVDDFQVTYGTTTLAGSDSVVTNTGPTTLTLGRTMITQGATIPLSKSGGPTAASVLSSSQNIQGAGLVFSNAGTQTGNATVGFINAGSVNGTVSIHNTATDSAGAGQGSADPDDVINITADALNNRQVSASLTISALTGSTYTGPVVYSSPDSDDTATRITVKSTATTSSTGPTSAINDTVAAGTQDVLFNGPSVTMTRNATVFFRTSGTQRATPSLAVTGEGLPGEQTRSALFAVVATVYQPASISANLPINPGDLLKIINADSNDNTSANGNFGRRAGARVISLNGSRDSAFSITGLAAGTFASNTGTVIGLGNSDGLGATFSGALNFDATHRLNGAYTGQLLIGLETANQAILGSAANDISPVNVPLNVVNSATSGTHAGTYSLDGGTLVAGTIDLSGSYAQSGGTATFDAITGTGSVSIVSGTADVIGSVGAMQVNTTASLIVGATSPATDSGSLAVVGNVALAANGAAASVVGSLVVGDNTAGTTAQLDLANNDLIIPYGAAPSPLATIRTLLKAGYNGGAWNGNGISSTAANTHAGQALGYGEAGDAGVTLLDGVAITGPAAVVKYTYYGDSSLDGKVDLGNDFNLFLQGFLKPSLLTDANRWEFGDYNYDGNVTMADFQLFVDGFKTQGGALGDLTDVISGSSLLTSAQKSALFAVVPEPSSIAVLALVAAGVTSRRRRSQ
jgi:hypothetical protein